MTAIATFFACMLMWLFGIKCHKKYILHRVKQLQNEAFDAGIGIIPNAQWRAYENVIRLMEKNANKTK